MTRSHSALERLITGVLAGMEYARQAEYATERPGLLQAIDPRVKFVGLFILIVAAASTPALPVIWGLLALGILLAAASGISFSRTLRAVWLGVLLFTGLLALPALFLVPGDPIWRIPSTNWVISHQGLQSVAYVVGRGLASVSLTTLLIATTPWPHTLKALRCLGVPVAFIAILNMCYRYLFLLLASAQEMFMARRSRLLAPPNRAQTRRMAVSHLAVLLERSLFLSEEVHLAMIARGYCGQDMTLHEFALTRRDWVAIAAFALVAVVAFGYGR
ncbi:Nickel transport protein NikQ [Castellaniella defragrans]